MAFSITAPDGNTISSQGKTQWHHVVIALADLDWFEADLERQRQTLQGFVDSGSWTEAEANRSLSWSVDQLATVAQRPWQLYSTHKSAQAALKGLAKAQADERYSDAILVNL